MQGIILRHVDVDLGVYVDDIAQYLERYLFGEITSNLNIVEESEVHCTVLQRLPHLNYHLGNVALFLIAMQLT